MMKRWLIAGAMLFATMLMLAPDEAQAQRRGGRGGWGNYSPGYYSPGWGYSTPGYYWGGRSGFGITIGSAYPFYGSGWSGYYPGYSYYWPGYGYSYPSYSYSYPTYSYSYPSYSYSTPGMITGGPTISSYTLQGDSAIVDVRVADPNAEVLIDGVATQQRGTERRFISPPLESGHRYSYEVKVRWSENGRMKEEKKTVDVSPGGTAMVDFRGVTTRSGEELAEPRPLPRP